MSSSLQYKRIKYNSNSKNRVNIIKNMKGMNDPAFKSNNTLKKYINEKLNSYLDPKLSLIAKTKSFSTLYEKMKNNIYISNKISYNLPNSQYSKIIQINDLKDSSPKINKSSNSLNKNNMHNNKRNIKMIEKPKSNSFIILKYSNSNKSLNKQNNKINEKSIYLNKNESPILTEYNKNNNTLINAKTKEFQTTPISELNKKRSIYNKNQIHLNQSVGFENINQRNNKKLNKVKDNNSIINQKLNNIKTNKCTLYRNSNNQIKLMKDEIYNILIKNELNNNIIPLNKSYFREESKISANNNSNIINRKNNYAKHNKLENKKENNSKNIVSLFKNKINNLLKNEESFNENECPVPMPYVKRYSENTIRNSGKSENINWENILLNKDLKEPKEEKKVPLPISLSINPNYFDKNNNKNQKNFVYSNSNKINNLNKRKL